MGAHIMVFNDAEELLEVFRDLLEEAGYTVTLSSYVPRQLPEIEAAKPDLIIADLVFGSERLGWELIEKVRLYPPLAHIPIVLCTAATRDVQEISAQLAARHVILVAKPFDVDTLLDAIRTALLRRPNVTPLRADENELPRGRGRGSGPSQ